MSSQRSHSSRARVRKSAGVWRTPGLATRMSGSGQAAIAAFWPSGVVMSAVTKATLPPVSAAISSARFRQRVRRCGRRASPRRPRAPAPAPRRARGPCSRRRRARGGRLFRDPFRRLHQGRARVSRRRAAGRNPPLSRGREGRCEQPRRHAEAAGDVLQLLAFGDDVRSVAG